MPFPTWRIYQILIRPSNSKQYERIAIRICWKRKRKYLKSFERFETLTRINRERHLNETSQQTTRIKDLIKWSFKPTLNLEKQIASSNFRSKLSSDRDSFRIWQVDSFDLIRRADWGIVKSWTWRGTYQTDTGNISEAKFRIKEI